MAVGSFCLVRNGSAFLIGVFPIIQGVRPLVILDGVVIVEAVFSEGRHATDLDGVTSLRKRVAG
ncbi:MULTISPECIES: hypothetical protein [Halolamina]|uniref:Uncharacterized protein n=1 Tax=Halolamina pelagica TaxID=699431 RepID=A0A1I5NWI1_9EURY|nr:MULTISPECIES: hypothetical protein [Halolamina]NHX36491.1 hypothetical protein [Halolamina sp. R1-12]SFP25611.1 hypothetical protein SAMN05216277_102208 [Halolamina pelagica]